MEGHKHKAMEDASMQPLVLRGVMDLDRERMPRLLLDAGRRPISWQLI